jgi:hypothetical protein
MCWRGLLFVSLRTCLCRAKINNFKVVLRGLRFVSAVPSKRSKAKCFKSVSTILLLPLAAVCNSQRALCRAPALTASVRNTALLTITRRVQTVVAYLKVLPATFMNKLTEMTGCQQLDLSTQTPRHGVPRRSPTASQFSRQFITPIAVSSITQDAALFPRFVR